MWRSVLTGRRRPDGTPPDDLEPGDYALSVVAGRARWVVRNPAGGFGVIDPRTHVVDRDPDGTITVRPVLRFDRGACRWHGWLERGAWREI